MEKLFFVPMSHEEVYNLEEVLNILRLVNGVLTSGLDIRDCYLFFLGLLYINLV